jgi:hypothetical protein
VDAEVESYAAGVTLQLPTWQAITCPAGRSFSTTQDYGCDSPWTVAKVPIAACTSVIDVELAAGLSVLQQCSQAGCTYEDGPVLFARLRVVPPPKQ